MAIPAHHTLDPNGPCCHDEETELGGQDGRIYGAPDVLQQRLSILVEGPFTELYARWHDGGNWHHSRQPCKEKGVDIARCVHEYGLSSRQEERQQRHAGAEDENV